MSLLLDVLLLASAIDGEAARRHAAALAALGPHPWGSPRAQVAAQYVAAQFRAAGLSDVRLEPFETHGIAGTNVTGVLRAPGPEWVALGAHHDTAPLAPGAYDDGGGVGVVIEAARVLVRRPPPRTIVFASWDGEEAWSTNRSTTTGSRAWLRAPGRDLARMVAAFDVEMSGYGPGRPVLHTIAYADPGRKGRSVVAPAWVVRAALRGAAANGQPFRVGDPWLWWLFQPGVRTFRVPLYGDDLSFLQAGEPAVFTSDSSFTAFYPWYHRPSDTADKLDAPALARMGRAVLGAVEELARTARGPSAEPDWYAAGTWVLGRTGLLALGALSLVPALAGGLRGSGRAPIRALLRASLFGVLLWRHPVPALWLFLLPNLAAFRSRSWNAIALLPALALAVLGAAAWARGMVDGLWLAWWELAAAAVLVAMGFWAAGARRASRKPGGKRRAA